MNISPMESWSFRIVHVTAHDFWVICSSPVRALFTAEDTRFPVHAWTNFAALALMISCHLRTGAEGVMYRLMQSGTCA